MQQIEGFSYPHRIVRAERREELKSAIEKDVREGRLSGVIHDSYMRIFCCPPSKGFGSSAVRSIVIAAVPQAFSQVSFEWKKTTKLLLVPPSYIRYWEISERIEAELNALLSSRGSRVRFARLPQKLLAVRSGLARYGKNNIAYIPEIGSLFMLASFYSDLACLEDTWLEPSSLDACRHCKACFKACPSGAIQDGSFPIRQEQCITFYSGYSGPQEFPSWLNPGWIECLVGCRRCQIVCPANAKLRAAPPEQEETFNEDETALLIEGPPPEKLPPLLKQKLDRMGLIRFFGFSACLEMLKRKLPLLLAN